ncbi:MAG: hypothetical protein GXP53_07930 [Deltaproteobacteria bacterium]|nr:hypothetical protein [Deltaproteobacteria bacterium]
MAKNKHRFSLVAVRISFRSLPLWVQVWVAFILVPVNAAAFLFTHTPTGMAAAVAAVFVVATNVPIMLYEGGMSRLMAIPHLFAWTPLTLFIIFRLLNLTGGPAMGKPELILAATLLLINSISLFFDTLDTVKWCRGEKDVPGHD